MDDKLIEKYLCEYEWKKVPPGDNSGLFRQFLKRHIADQIKSCKPGKARTEDAIRCEGKIEAYEDILKLC